MREQYLLRWNQNIIRLHLIITYLTYILNLIFNLLFTFIRNLIFIIIKKEEIIYFNYNLLKSSTILLYTIEGTYMKNIFIQTQTGQFISLIVTEKEGIIKKRKVKTWTNEEDNLLIKLYQQYPKKWIEISRLMNDRNQNQCLHRFRRLCKLGNQKKIWTEEQDQTIKKYIKKVGKNWKILSEVLGSKTGKQIRERYINKLDPKIKKQEWSEQEDMKLIELYSLIGSKWSQIAKKLPGRPQNKIKNRFYSFIKRNYEIKQTLLKVNSKNQRSLQNETAHQNSEQKNQEIYSQLSNDFNIFDKETTKILEDQLQIHKTIQYEQIFNQIHLSTSQNLNKSKILLEGSQQLIEQMNFNQKRNQISWYADIPEASSLIYLDGMKNNNAVE